MKNNYLVIDTDTHVGPSIEVLQKYAGPTLVERWDELLPYYQKLTAGGHGLSINPIPYRRKFGLKAEQEAGVVGGVSPLKGAVSATLKIPPAAGINDEDAIGRLENMDLEGVDQNLIFPSTFVNAISIIDLALAKEIYDAYHRYIAEYCSADPSRLRATIFVTGADPDWSVGVIKRLQHEQWVASVSVVLPEGMPVDDDRLHPIWSAMGDADLPMMHHSFFYEPPYFPGYRDIWDNVVVARAAAHPWGAERLVGYIVLSGLLDKFPRLRIGFAECSAGWLPGWLVRLQGQASYMSGAVPALSHTPLEYAQDGRIACGIELYETQELAEAIIKVCGEGVLMYQSDFPHPGSDFPNSPDTVLAWEPAIGSSAVGKILSGNAQRFLRLS